MRRAGRAALAGLMIIPCVWAAQPAGAAESKPNARNVLVISLGNVKWSELPLDEMPHLKQLLEGSALAEMTVHGANEHPSADDGYLTINTGARSEGAARVPQPVCSPAGAAIKCPAVGAEKTHNDKLLFNAKVGLLGDTLAAAGISRTVLGGPAAALAFVDRNGTVPNNRSAARAVVVAEPFDGTYGAVDARIGALLKDVDLARDAVIVVSPWQRAGPLTTTVAAMHAPGLEPGLLKSAYTRRSGTVALVDVAPTILDQLGIERPTQMEGRPFVFGRSMGGFDQRLNWVTATQERARFRDVAITQVAGIYMAAVFVLVGGALLLFLLRLRHGRALLQFGALTLLFFLPATYVSMELAWARQSMPHYWAVTAGMSVVAALAAYLSIARTSLLPVMIALGAIAGLIMVDVLTGARLQFNGTFGYSPSIGGRYAGLGNQGYAMLAASSVLLAGLIVFRFARRGLPYVIAILVAAIVVDGMPLFGADVGGVLSMVPAFGVTIAMLAGWRFRWRLVAAFGAIAVALLGVFAVIDLARPAGDRSHLGRLLGGGGGGGGARIVLERKLTENLDVVASTPFTWILPVVYAIGAVVIYAAPGPLRVVRDRIPPLNASLVGLAIVAVLGTILNDSGIAITGLMFAITTSTLVFLCARVAVP